MVAGVWANTNMDDSEERRGARAEALRAVDKWARDVIGLIYGEEPVKEAEIDKDDPFFARMKLPELVVSAVNTDAPKVEGGGDYMARVPVLVDE